MEQFIDLLQTWSVTMPIFIGLIVLLGVIGLALYFWPKPDEPQGKQAEIEALAKQQAALEELYAQDLPEHQPEPVKAPPQRMDSLHRGASMPIADETTIKVVNTPYSDMAARYGFESYKRYANNELILFDRELPSMEVQLRVETLPLPMVIRADAQELRRLMSNARRSINRRARSAGIEPVRRRVGRPTAKGAHA